ncbi:hypothetical protein PGTUg99_033404 [Puccinia graminis f. sp. tritici]|uniref:Uncharacterized protein n=1 Tax=Puccinia graminis f. sp. tritici TaxID=56615 RepID=A0A5B0S934_PUCGR|nr:hypothetical protein PGTUg99_033404 [Puccinia graminis f. sp. tritici]
MTPPVVEQISAKKPNIRMLKLMVTLDNLAEGVGQVFQMILEQSGLSKEEFFGCLQPMDGDLGKVWKVRRALVDFLHFSAQQHVLLWFVVRGSLLDAIPLPLLLQTPLLPAIPHTSFLLLPTRSSAVTPSHSACHPSDACQSVYSSSPPWIGPPPPLPPLVRSKPHFCLSVLPLPCSPSAAYTKPQSAVGREPRSPPVPGFPAASFSEPCAFDLLFPAIPCLRKLRLSTNIPPLSSACMCSVSSACFPHQPRAFHIHPNNLSKALATARSHHHNGSKL